MAINDRPDIRCGWQHGPGPAPPAVAVVRTSQRRSPPDIALWPQCADCIAALAAIDHPVPYDVAYLDPARQRRPDPADIGHTRDPDGPDHDHV
jgi:hypothetical protein